MTKFRSKPYYEYLEGQQWFPGCNHPGVEESPLGYGYCKDSEQRVFSGDWVMVSECPKTRKPYYEVYRKDVIANGYDHIAEAVA